MTTVPHKSLHSVHGMHNNNKQNRKLKEANIRVRHLSHTFKLFLITNIYFCGNVLVWGSVCSRATAFADFPLACSPLLIWSTQTAMTCLCVWIQSCTSCPHTCTLHLWSPRTPCLSSSVQPWCSGQTCHLLTWLSSSASATFQLGLSAS